MTLVEILAVVAIMTVLFAAVMSAFGPYRDEQILNAEASAVESLLNKARAQTLSSLDDSVYGVHFESGRAVLFRGFAFSEPSAYNEEAVLNPHAEISDIDLLSGGNDVVFARLTGEATSTSGTTTISLISDPAKKRKIFILPAGIVRQE